MFCFCVWPSFIGAVLSVIKVYFVSFCLTNISDLAPVQPVALRLGRIAHFDVLVLEMDSIGLIHVLY